MPPYSVTWPTARADDHRIRVEIRPPALPWPVVFYFSEVRDDAEQILFVYEGSEDGAPVGLEQDGIDAEPAMRAAEHWREHRGDYQRMAEFLCRPIPPNLELAAQVYAAKILRWRRLRRTDADRLKVRDAYRACVARNGRVHGAIQEVAGDLWLNRKAVRHALDDCVDRGEMNVAELPPSRRAVRLAERS